MLSDRKMGRMGPSPWEPQPIVICGGFLSHPGVYAGMSRELERMTGQPVRTVQAFVHDWLRQPLDKGWVYLLDQLEQAVRQARLYSASGKVTLIGHSAGGLLSRLFLSSEPFRGHTYSGVDCVDLLVTLGSPHYTSGRTLAHTQNWVEKRYPGAYFAPRTRYFTVAGQGVLGARRGSIRQRMAYRFYQHVNGSGDIWGDGLVPVESALLEGAQHLVLDGVSHAPEFSKAWYGTPAVIAQWWPACLEKQLST
jgi:hypothetical protein